VLKCRDISHKAGDYVEEQLTFKSRLSYSFHLILCGHCRLFLRHFRATIAYTRAINNDDQPSDQQVSAILEKALKDVSDTH
jgi:hypothetical protein